MIEAMNDNTPEKDPAAPESPETAETAALPDSAVPELEQRDSADTATPDSAVPETAAAEAKPAPNTDYEPNWTGGPAPAGPAYSEPDGTGPSGAQSSFSRPQDTPVNQGNQNNSGGQYYGAAPAGQKVSGGQKFFNSLRTSQYFRSQTRILGGVAAGLARKWNIDPTLMRGLIILTAIFGGIGILAYALAWALLPEEGSGRILTQELLATKFDGAWIVIALLVLVGLGGFSVLLPFSGFLLLAPLSLGSLSGGWAWHSIGPASFLRLSVFPLLLLSILTMVGALWWVGREAYRKHLGRAAKIGAILMLVGLGAGFLFLLVSPAFPPPVRNLGITMMLWGFTFPFLALPTGLIAYGLGAMKASPGVFPTPTPPYPAPATHETQAGPATAFAPPLDPRDPATSSQEEAGLEPAETSATPASPATQETQAGPADPTLNFGPQVGPATSVNTGAAFTTPIIQTPPPPPRYAPLQYSPAPYPPVLPPPPPRPPRRPGPGAPLSLTIGALVMLLGAGVCLYILLEGSKPVLFPFTIGVLTLILASGMIVAALRGRRGSWITVTAALVTGILVVPMVPLIGYGPNGLRDISRYHNGWFVGKQEYGATSPSGAMVAGVSIVDLRDLDAAQLPAERAYSLGVGRLRLLVREDQAINVEVSLGTGSVNLYSLGSWFGSKLGQDSQGHPTFKPDFAGVASVENGDVPARLSNYYDRDGKRIEFSATSLNTVSSLMDLGNDEDDWNLDLDLHNAKARSLAEAGAENKEIEIELQLAAGEVEIVEYPATDYWQGQIGEDGNFLIDSWFSPTGQKHRDAQMPGLTRPGIFTGSKDPKDFQEPEAKAPEAKVPEGFEAPQVPQAPKIPEVPEAPQAPEGFQAPQVPEAPKAFKAPQGASQADELEKKLLLERK